MSKRLMNGLIKGAVFLAVFVLASLLIGRTMNRGNENLIMAMPGAAFPLITMEKDGMAYNQLRGYAQEMEAGYQRETVTELGENRQLIFRVDSFDTEISNLRFEVRSADGKRLVESTAVTAYARNEKDGSLRCQIELKDLIEAEEEYLLVILLEAQGQGTVRYYTRVIWSEDTHAAEKLAFAKKFHEALYDRKKAQEEGIAQYLESNTSGDNTSFHRVNIHSSFKQITWGDLEVTEETEPVLQLTDLGSQTASMTMQYVVSTREESKKTYYMVEEAYRVRYPKGAERMYLLSYDRTMTQIPAENEGMFAGDKILLGIVDENFEFTESGNGQYVVFEAAGRLCSFDVSNQKMTVLFSPYDSENRDNRVLFGKQDIKVLQVEQSGDVYFAVYGYLNRGHHEGQTGLVLYRYDNNLNTVEEMVYIPSVKSADTVRCDLEQLLYMNEQGQLYLFLDQSIYQVNAKERTYRRLTSIGVDGSMSTSASHKVLVWQNGRDSYHADSLTVMNLVDGSTGVIQAPEGAAVRLQGFMGEDVIYGMARLEDITDSHGKIFFPMYSVCISDARGVPLMESGQEGIYVTDCSVEEGQITLERIVRLEDGTYQETVQDYIMINEDAVTGKNVLSVAVTERYEKYVQIQMKTVVDPESVQVRSAKEVTFEGDRELLISAQEPEECFYVYGPAGLERIYLEPSTAFLYAYETSGIVTDSSGSLLFRRGNLVTRNQIMAITEQKAAEGQSSLAVCLDTILQLSGLTRNTQELLEQGMSAYDILSENLSEYRVLELHSVPMQAMLYYLNRDIPVLALLENGEAVLLTGFNEYNVVVMDPVAGTLKKQGMNDTAEWLEENGNRFMAPIPQ